MLALFFNSIAHHLAWWVASFWPGKCRAAPLSLRRILFLFLGYPLFLGLQLTHWFGFLLDEILFRNYKKVKIEKPVFISGIPRSGTTFLHRTLATDLSYTFFTTWEATLAPSITERKIISAFAVIDRAIGSPLGGLIHSYINKSSGDFNSIHEVGLDAPEEDYLALLPIGACFILLLAFPFSKALNELSSLDQIPLEKRERFIQFYKQCLQRHLYCNPGKILLSKNAAFSSWLPALLSAFPDARILICIRNPNTALSSQLSSLAPARKLFGTDPTGSHTEDQFYTIYAQSYKVLAKFTSNTRVAAFSIIDQADLRADAAGTIRSALKHVGISASVELNVALDRLQPNPTSSHKHDPSDFSIDSDQIESCMYPAYEAMLRNPKRSLPAIK